MKTNEYQKENFNKGKEIETLEMEKNKKKLSKFKIKVIIIVSCVVLFNLFVGIELCMMIFNQSKDKPILYLSSEQNLIAPERKVSPQLKKAALNKFNL